MMPARKSIRNGGFTLLEILVVMALLSVVMLALGAALRTIAQTETRIDNRLARADEFRMAVAFLRKTLGQVSAHKVATPAKAGGGAVLFAAQPDAVAWVGVMPARYGVGGRHFFRLAVEPETDGMPRKLALVIRFMPWKDTPDFPDWSKAPVRTLVSDVVSMTLSYENSQVTPALTSAGWVNTDRLPDRMGLNLQTTSGPYPLLVVPLRPLPLGTGNAGGFAIGGALD